MYLDFEYLRYACRNTYLDVSLVELQMGLKGDTAVIAYVLTVF